MADPAGDDWVVTSLSSAARAAIANGAPDSAIAYLRRALAEPPSGRLRPGVLLELGFAESYAGDPQAAAHLQAALATAVETTAQVAITLALGRMLQIDGRNQEALEVFDRVRAAWPARTGGRRSRSRAPPSAQPSSMPRPQMMPPSASPACAGWPT